MKYSSYTAEDLVLNPEFREWVLNPTVASNTFWENWLKQYPEKLQEVKEAKEILKKFPLEHNQLKDEVVEDIWKILEQASKNDEFDEAKDNTYVLNSETVISRFETKKEQKGISLWRKCLRYAAVAVLVIASIVGYNSLDEQKTEKSNVPKHIAMVNKETQRGQKSTIYLKDGSKVVLNANSKLTYPEQFSKENRLVILEGEAFFEVAKESNRPFQVRTGSVTTTALGTSFNINTRNEAVHIALATGKVVVSGDSKNQEPDIILKPGEDTRYFTKTQEFVTGLFDYDLILGWKDQTIVFKKADEDDVFSTLENWYDVDITRTNKPSLTWDYSGEFIKMDLNSVLLSIGFTMDFEYTIKEQKVTITYH
ncbi:FecR family protein [Reichenbachiella sp. MALMAid0571]|uniref:FecR family protein n=1 Tax=Reichenbachiella sp. MALMAid0571 TaxID=3143939 RepID=UPI0032DF9FAE